MIRPRFVHFALLLLLVSTLSHAQTKGIVTFGGLKNLEFINDYYNGGTGSLGSGPPAKNLHLQFTGNAQAIVQAAKGGSGNFIGDPGNYPVMFFQTGNNVTINATDKISTALWFFYSALQPGTATVYDGPNGTGNILASITLTPNDAGCNTYKMCVWSPVGVVLSTPVASIRFGGAANFLAIGSIHLGAKLPTSMVLKSSLNPSLQGEAVTFTATVSATGAVPVGSATFKAGNKVIGSVALVNGIASLTLTALPTGSTKITATFKTPGYVTSTANLIQTVN